jgi:hypothetical protein
MTLGVPHVAAAVHALQQLMHAVVRLCDPTLTYLPAAVHTADTLLKSLLLTPHCYALLCLVAPAVVCGGASIVAAAARILRHPAQPHCQPAAQLAARQQCTQQPCHKPSNTQPQRRCCCCCECGGQAVRGVCWHAAGFAGAVRAGWIRGA